MATLACAGLDLDFHQQISVNTKHRQRILHSRHLYDKTCSCYTQGGKRSAEENWLANALRKARRKKALQKAGWEKPCRKKPAVEPVKLDRRFSKMVLAGWEILCRGMLAGVLVQVGRRVSMWLSERFSPRFAIPCEPASKLVRTLPRTGCFLLPAFLVLRGVQCQQQPVSLAVREAITKKSFSVGKPGSR